MLSSLKFIKSKKKNKEVNLVQVKKNEYIAGLLEKIGFSWLRRFKIRQRLIISFLVLSIVPLTVVGFFSYNDTSFSLEKSMSDSSEIIYSEVAKKIEQELNRYPELIQELLFRSKIQEDLLVFSKKTAYEKMDFNRNISSTFVSLYSLKPEILNMELISEYIDT